MNLPGSVSSIVKTPLTYVVSCVPGHLSGPGLCIFSMAVLWNGSNFIKRHSSVKGVVSTMFRGTAQTESISTASCLT